MEKEDFKKMVVSVGVGRHWDEHEENGFRGDVGLRRNPRTSLGYTRRRISFTRQSFRRSLKVERESVTRDYPRMRCIKRDLARLRAAAMGGAK